MESILVIGGTGKTGRKVVEKLENKGYNVRVGSRQADPSFDWSDAETWDNALEGVDKVYVTYQPDLAVPGALQDIELFVRKAARHNIKKIVLLSGKGEREAELSEQVVIHSGISYTIVRASWFMQNFSESFLMEPILSGHVYLPKASARVPYVDTGDIADVVVETLTDPRHDGRMYELTGPRVLTFPEVIAEISEAAGNEIGFTPVTLPAYVKSLGEHGVPADYVWLINYLFSEVLDAEGNDRISGDIEKVLGRPPRDFREYAQEAARMGAWHQAV